MPIARLRLALAIALAFVAELIAGLARAVAPKRAIAERIREERTKPTPAIPATTPETRAGVTAP